MFTELCDPAQEKPRRPSSQRPQQYNRPPDKEQVWSPDAMTLGWDRSCSERSKHTGATSRGMVTGVSLHEHTKFSSALRPQAPARDTCMARPSAVHGNASASRATTRRTRVFSPGDSCASCRRTLT